MGEGQLAASSLGSRPRGHGRTLTTVGSMARLARWEVHVGEELRPVVPVPRLRHLVRLVSGSSPYWLTLCRVPARWAGTATGGSFDGDCAACWRIAEQRQIEAPAFERLGPFGVHYVHMRQAQESKAGETSVDFVSTLAELAATAVTLGWTIDGAASSPRVLVVYDPAGCDIEVDSDLEGAWTTADWSESLTGSDEVHSALRHHLTTGTGP